MFGNLQSERRHCHISFGALTCNPVFTLTLHLRGLHVDALVTDEPSTGDASIRLTEAFVGRPEHR